MLGKSEDFGTAALERRTSMRLCDLDEIKVCVDRQYENCHGYSGNKKAIYREAILAVKSVLHSAKPIDAVPVVRCRECVHWKPSGSKAGNSFSDMEYIGGCEFTKYCRRESDFCSYGERKEGVSNEP